MWSGSPLSLSNVSGEWLWKRCPAALFSTLSSASSRYLALTCSCLRRTAALVEVRTQSNRRSTVMGSMTRSYCGGR